MTELLQFTFSGVTVGSVYALVALGFALIYNASDVVNFAQGEFVMIGGMAAAAFTTSGVPLALSIILAVLLAALAGWLLEKLAIERVLDEPPATAIIVTIGASLLLRGVAQIVVDKQNHGLPPLLGGGELSILGATIQIQALAVLAGATFSSSSCACSSRGQPPGSPCVRRRPTVWRRASSAWRCPASSRSPSSCPPRSAPSAACWSRRLRRPAMTSAHCWP